MMLSTDLQRGGFPLRLVRLAKSIVQHGVEPVVGCLAPRGPLHQELERAGIATFACDADGPFDAACLLRLARVIRRINPDLIHAGLFHSNIAARLVGGLDRRRPLITSSVTIEIERYWHRWGEALTSGWSDVHVANSPAVARHLCDELGFDRERVIVIPNGVDIAAVEAAPGIDRREHGFRDDVPLVAWAGRMDPVKDLHTFVDVIGLLAARRPIQAVLLGDGPERGAMEGLIRQRGLAGVIRMPGWQENIVGWLKSADVLLFPSRTEGSPNAVLEAMAAGAAVAASDIAPCRDLIEPGRTGVLSPVGDAGAFAGAVERLLADGAARTRMVENAGSWVRSQHNLQQIVVRWVQAYHSIGGDRDTHVR